MVLLFHKYVSSAVPIPFTLAAWVKIFHVRIAMTITEAHILVVLYRWISGCNARIYIFVFFVFSKRWNEKFRHLQFLAYFRTIVIMCIVPLTWTLSILD